MISSDFKTPKVPCISLITSNQIEPLNDSYWCTVSLLPLHLLGIVIPAAFTQHRDLHTGAGGAQQILVELTVKGAEEFFFFFFLNVLTVFFVFFLILFIYLSIFDCVGSSFPC